MGLGAPMSFGVSLSYAPLSNSPEYLRFLERSLRRYDGLANTRTYMILRSHLSTRNCYHSVGKHAIGVTGMLVYCQSTGPQLYVVGPMNDIR